MAKSNNAWLTQLHYAFQDEYCLYLAMDFHPGGDLAILLGRQVLCIPICDLIVFIFLADNSCNILHYLSVVNDPMQRLATPIAICFIDTKHCLKTQQSFMWRRWFWQCTLYTHSATYTGTLNLIIF